MPYLHYQFNAKIVSKTADEDVHLLTGLSVSSSLRIDLPSISAGISTPAMSSIVGAKSTFNTICELLQGSKNKMAFFNVIYQKGHSDINLSYIAMHIYMQTDNTHMAPCSTLGPLT